ncbi:MAG: 2-(1,2-epoxy-1,2-dihydrophenyl)acetyl-CoA isomerase [Blastocatellia bacterium AA13]|nr:MAG: 2-(1,2-epoxy-1,2-dihydrophenyl)acetyl-CoA isomerase [Blastocatellia bacterium AA13]
MSEKLLVTLDGAIKRITFNQPSRRNAIDTEMMESLRAAIQESAEDESRVIILSGAGDAFCAGADLQSGAIKDRGSIDVTASLRTFTNPTILAMRNLGKPIIARINGHAVGVGCNYALACDILIASEQAKFGQAFIKIALMPDGGSTYTLPRLVGYHKAFELMATGDLIGAADALALGMINRVVPFEQLDSVVDELAARLAASAPMALARIKQGLVYAASHDMAEALEFEAVNQAACFQSDDFGEGVKAFLEKRKPGFTGR